MRPYRADVVGSLLRPEYLLRARDAFAAGHLGAVEFKRVEDRAVDEAIALQERAGVDVVTDGEMRRGLFLSQLVQAMEGFERLPEGIQYTWYRMDGEAETGTLTFAVTGKIRRKRHLSTEEFAYLRGKTARPTKITLPSPTMFCFYWVPGRSEAAYPSAEAFLADVTDILRDEVAEQVRLGAEYIQIEAPEFGVLLEPRQQDWFRSKGFEPDRVIEGGIDMPGSRMTGGSSWD
ncbi:MAG: hypothetical protein ACT4PY_12440 [Armatimonadota bacterium]